MNPLLDSINNFFTAILNIYPELPYDLGQQLRTMQAFIKAYDHKQLFLIQSFVRRLQSKASTIKFLNKKKKEQLKTQPNFQGDEQNKENVFNYTNIYKQNSSGFLKYQDDKNRPYKMIDGIKLSDKYGAFTKSPNLQNVIKFQSRQNYMQKSKQEMDKIQSNRYSFEPNNHNIQNAFNFNLNLDNNKDYLQNQLKDYRRQQDYLKKSKDQRLFFQQTTSQITQNFIQNNLTKNADTIVNKQNLQSKTNKGQIKKEKQIYDNSYSINLMRQNIQEMKGFLQQRNNSAQISFLINCISKTDPPTFESDHTEENIELSQRLIDDKKSKQKIDTFNYQCELKM